MKWAVLPQQSDLNQVDVLQHKRLADFEKSLGAFTPPDAEVDDKRCPRMAVTPFYALLV
ncbi:MAG: hypothetical protein M1546_21935 [Chloroflexi bacterium]|nr:hypothetical protein [Chloroflexota bacterium]